MTTEFQSAPPQVALQPQLPKKSFREQIRERKTLIIIGCITLFILLGTGAYFFAPIRDTMVAPANTENTGFENVTIPSPTPRRTTQLAIPTPTPTPLPTPGPSTTWKTYTNSVNGYTIKYPPDWRVYNPGSLDPKVPSYITFIPPSATESARLITITISTRTYAEQLALGTSSSAITAAGIQGTKQFFQDSNGAQSTAVILPRSNNLLILRTKTEALSTFNLMLSTLTNSK